MKMININGVECEVLGTVNTGKREYIFVINNNKVEYYKRCENGFVKPSNDLSLEGYAGKSLTELNENVLITHMLKLMKEEYIKA